MKIKIGIIFFIFFCFTNVNAHGDLHARIVQTTKEIETKPDSAFLYFKRGKLYFQHEEYELSLNDLEQSKSKGNRDNYLLLYLSKVNHKLGYFQKALQHIDSILIIDYQNVLAHRIRGRILFDDNQFSLAAQSFEKVIKRSLKTFPENYLDAAIAWECSNEQGALNKIYDIMEKGIFTLGPIVTLYAHLVGVAIKFKDFDKAILYQQKIIDISTRKELPHYRMHEIYLTSGNITKAKEEIFLAKKAYNLLPLRIKNSSAMKTLLINIEEQEVKLRSKLYH